MVNKIKIKEKIIYYSEIIHPLVFKNLYLKEKPIQNFFSYITTDTGRLFLTFYSKNRKVKDFKQSDILILRINKRNKQAQFISKMYQWGKIHISKKIVCLLHLKNHEKINLDVISRNEKIEMGKKKNTIDLSNLNGEKITTILRANDFITIYTKQKVPITLPRFIKITSELFELFFLIHGDGHYKTKLFFVNKNPELLQFVLDKFESILTVPKMEWRVKTLISNLNNEDSANLYWKNKLKLEKSQFYSASKSKLNTDKYGNLRIILDKTIVARLFRFIFYKLKQNLNTTTSLHALNGLLCAEWGAQLNKKSLHKITLTLNKEEKPLFDEILIKTRVMPICKWSQNKTYIIESWGNHYLFFKKLISNKIIPFRYHPQRRNNVIRGFLSHSFTRTMIKYLYYLRDIGSLELKELTKLLCIRRDSIIDTISKERYKKFMSFKKEIKPQTVEIREEGLIFLDLINDLQKMGGTNESKPTAL